MLRVSSYRRLFEEEQWSQGGGAGLLCGGQYRSSIRGNVTGSDWAEPDFEAARALNKESLTRVARERRLIAALNDRLAFLIETARCLEEENESLEAQILELEERQRFQGARSTTEVPDCGLEAIVERLRREKEQILCDVTELKRELGILQAKHEETVSERALIQLEREDVGVDVDAVTAECLALREQVAIYEQQLATMQEEHEMTVETLAEPTADAVTAVTLEFPSPDVAPVILEIKEYYSELAESLQYEAKATAGVTIREQRKGDGRKVSGVKAKDVSRVTDVGELRKLIAELQKELAELEKRGLELENEIQGREVAQQDEIAELECCVAELEASQEELEAQMREQCGDYEELLSEKMALEIEIAAYRGLVDEEVERLCYL